MTVKNLNDAQLEATLHNKGPMMVLSGPGSGKTTVITYRVKNLIEKFGVLSNEILVITFTKAAAEEMKMRFNNLCDNIHNVMFATFHSYFFKIIRVYYKYDLNNILNDYDKNNIIKEIIYKNNIYFDNGDEFIQNIINEISFLKNELINPIFFESSVTNTEEFYKIYKEYEDMKAQMNKIDFDDMLIKCYNLIKNDENVREFWKNKYKYILIDEFQDINRVQYECIKMLLSCEKNIFIVGDDDQSIYGFRGSKPDFILRFPRDFENTKKVILNVNYRSTKQIIKLCNTIIEENENRYKKSIIGTDKTFKAPLLVRNHDVNEEAKKVAEKIKELSKNYALENIAVIYRMNIQAMPIIEKFMDYNIDYQLKDKIPSIYDHFISKDILAYLNLALDKYDNDSFLRIANKPKRFLNKTIILDAMSICKNEKSVIEYLYSDLTLKSWQLEKINDLLFHIGQIKAKKPYAAIKYILKIVGYEDYLEEYANFKNIGVKGLLEISSEILEASENYETIYEYLEHIKEIKEKISENPKNMEQKGVVLTTMHSAKGLEFDVVFVIGCIDGIVPHEKSKSIKDIEEERRLFYVALTRARKILYISILDKKHDNKVLPSRFLKTLIKCKR